MSSRGANEQGYVGFAYDYGEYPKIVAVHSSINHDDSPSLDELQKPRRSQFHGNQLSKGNQEERLDVREPQFSEGPQYSIDSRFSDCQSMLGYQNFLRYQKELHARGFPIKEFPSSHQNAVQQMSSGYQHGRLENRAYLSSPHIQQMSIRQDVLRYPKNNIENLRFQPIHHNGYFPNRFEAPPIFGVHPAMLMPEAMDVHRTHLVQLNNGNVLSRNGQHGPFPDPSPSVNVKSILYHRLSSKDGDHIPYPSSTNITREDCSTGSRKRNYSQINHGNVADERSLPAEGVRQLIPPGIMFNGSTIIRPNLANVTDKTDMMMFHVARGIQTRVPYFNRHLSCNDLVDAAIHSAKRYAVNSARVVNYNEREYAAIEGTKNTTNEKTELKIPNQWMSEHFFEQILLHENRYDLLQTLKVAASSGREVLLYVLKKLLSKKVIENALILLDNIKRSDLPNSVKEKVLSVVQELLWGHSPRYDLWQKETVENREGIASEKDTRIVIVEDDESLGDVLCKEKVVLKDHLEASRKDITLLLGSDGAGDNGNDCGRVSLHENSAQKPEKISCEKDLDDLQKSNQDETQRLSVNNCQSEEMSENKQCPAFDDETSRHNQSDERGKYSSDIMGRNSENSSEIEHSSNKDINQKIVSDGDGEPKESTKGEALCEKEVHNDVAVGAFKTRDQCIQVENLNDLKTKENNFNDCEGIFRETNETVFGADSRNNCYSVDETIGLENSDLELLGEVSIIVDSQGNTIIKEEIEDGESLEDGITIKGLNLLRHWAELQSSDDNLLTIKEEANEKAVQSSD